MKLYRCINITVTELVDLGEISGDSKNVGINVITALEQYNLVPKGQLFIANSYYLDSTKNGIVFT